MSTDAALEALWDRWRDAKPGELANAQLYLTGLCRALGVEEPRPSGTGYEFEFSVRVVHRDGTEAVNRVDLFKQDHFLLEAKDEGGATAASSDLLLRKAFGQASSYAAYVPGGHPPYLMVLDVGRTLRVWDRWSGSYGGFQGAVRTIDLTQLAERPEDVEFLRTVWEDPYSLDPNARAAAVTKEIAGKLATLAARLERSGEGQERVARFLIRCVFTMFAEDVGLLKDEPFRKALELGLENAPGDFEDAVAALWAAMDEGRPFGIRKLLRFNGHFFHDQDVIPLERDDLAVLLEAALADWSHVEPSIFGTLLTRALDREERHRLGAEFTPRAYVERLVRPTIEEPVRERWTMVQAEVIQLREHGTDPAIKKAIARLREFHHYLRSIRVLDPACGSGNFLYVSLSVLKEIELEVVRELESITGQHEVAVEQVGPWQFHGIEVKPWAREVAELCLWVGHHQWWRRTHGHIQPPEPVLQDTGTFECRDAVLAWDEIREVPEKARPDPTPRIEHPVTGELVPDPEASLPYYEYVGARQAEWPEADFIVGNPPYMGDTRMRSAFGDGYVDALREQYEAVPSGADYVMHWWYRAAKAVAESRTQRAGLITTNSIVQSRNRRVVEAMAEDGAMAAWVVRDHPWVDESGAADVRVAMTVLTREPSSAKVITVSENGEVQGEVVADRLNADLTAHADVASAANESLLANEGLSSMGFALYGSGFIVEPDEAAKLLAADSSHKEVLKPYRHGRDLAARPRGVWLIDFGLRTEDEARSYPVLFDIIRNRVKPQRETNKRKSIRENWWQFGWPRPVLREALEGLPRYIATGETAKHRFFVLLDAGIAPDNKLICIASERSEVLGVLSSQIHVHWALAAGGRLGVGNDPVYVKSKCFDPFPFPELRDREADEIGATATRLENHRNAALGRDETVTMTGMYNVVEKLRSGEPLTPKERKIHQIAACGVLRDLHDELDRLVAEAYGWPWPMETEEILARLVALHDERVEEEKRGKVRWLRPDYQIPQFGDKVEGQVEGVEEEEREAEKAELPDWPADAIEQLTAIRDVAAARPRTVEQTARQFRGARRADVQKHLETLQVLGVLAELDAGRYYARGVGVVPSRPTVTSKAGT